MTVRVAPGEQKGTSQQSTSFDAKPAPNMLRVAGLMFGTNNSPRPNIPTRATSIDVTPNEKNSVHIGQPKVVRERQIIPEPRDVLEPTTVAPSPDSLAVIVAWAFALKC